MVNSKLSAFVFAVASLLLAGGVVTEDVCSLDQLDRGDDPKKDRNQHIRSVNKGHDAHNKQKMQVRKPANKGGDGHNKQKKPVMRPVGQGSPAHNVRNANNHGHQNAAGPVHYDRSGNVFVGGGHLDLKAQAFIRDINAVVQLFYRGGLSHQHSQFEAALNRITSNNLYPGKSWVFSLNELDKPTKKFSIHHKKSRIHIVQNDSVNAALANQNGTNNVCFVNYANATLPGGGVLNNGDAQEEDVCKTTNLYPSLIRQDIMKNYYLPNMRADPNGEGKAIYSAGIRALHRPGTVLSCLTCAAPKYNQEPDKKKCKRIMTNQVLTVVKAAIVNNVDVLVLGAWGSGVYKYPPAEVAKIMKYVLIDQGYGRYFDKVVFVFKKAGKKSAAYISAFRDLCTVDPALRVKLPGSADQHKPAVKAAKHKALRNGDQNKPGVKAVKH